ncbi:MAG: protein phosphatase CheZ [Roseomonas sp.]|jgi:chemotaxis protein CheZ|nr:protein phosphatase CheZ [Roseomonas sp.]MCA3275097.1 protein phosphatase CheZ [Roseomonas sp.]MCA3297226.1 protein phosphatase CheZ [Roseomonas sp.]MCA4919828.1 protein phosphatase CheZ [Roseomonas sp.]
MPDGTPQGPEGDRIEATVRAVLTSMAGDLTAKESALLAELEGLGRTIARAKAEIAALKVEDIRDAHIPSATDELDAIVDHTAHATNEILDCCETLEQLQAEISGEAADKLQGAVTRIYEACSFQDITGQRIGKVVTALKAIEGRISAVVSAASGMPGPEPASATPTVPSRDDKRTEGEKLANGPQLPGSGVSQSEIDRLLASFD